MSAQQKVKHVYSYQWFSISRIIAMRTEKRNKIYLLSIHFKRWIVYCIVYYCTNSAHGNNLDGRQAYARARKGMCKRELTDISLHTSSHSSLHCCTVHRTQQYWVTTISWAFQFWPIISNLLLLEIYNYVLYLIWISFRRTKEWLAINNQQCLTFRLNCKYIKIHLH